ncbi:hypothetical protein [Caulobacter sp. 17J65-9]|uniref:hypothetical protein n=1 Tax=Caulobacter sp. 17J65-9 TaxID=2709382 RepID=UPI0013C7A92B|nr:hypothetical protein [Caulobacter sp. 17J65-9]NEX92903.1 hypothetical protein [Caulobacter sp. 17J65-9]
MDERQTQFHLHEYDALRGEIIALVVAMNRLVQFGMTAVAAASAWVLTVTHRDGPTWMWTAAAWLPFWFSVLVAFHYTQLRGQVRKLARYTVRLEAELGAPDLGWERSPERVAGGRAGSISFSTRVMLGAMHVLALALGLSLTLQLYVPPEWFEQLPLACRVLESCG